MLRNPSCGSRKNLRGSPTHFLDFFDRCANPFSLHPLRGAQKRSPRRSPALGFTPFFYIKITGTKRCPLFWRRRRDLKLLCNPSCGSRKNLRGSPTHLLDFFDRCANPFSLHPLRGAPKRSPRRSPALGFIPIFAQKNNGHQTVSVILAQKEGFEPSRRLPDLLP